jgi:peroxiredoxin
LYRTSSRSTQHLTTQWHTYLSTHSSHHKLHFNLILTTERRISFIFLITPHIQTHHQLNQMSKIHIKQPGQSDLSCACAVMDLGFSSNTRCTKHDIDNELQATTYTSFKILSNTRNSRAARAARFHRSL